MTRLVILGAGGHGKVVADVAQLSQDYDKLLFLDDAFERIGECAGLPVAGPLSDFSRYINEHTHFFVAMGSCAGRQSWLQQLLAAKAQLATLIHPTAIIAHSVVIESGVLICAGAIINPDSKIGLGVIINTGATIDHDCVIGAYSHVCPGVSIAGMVHVGELCWLGIGANVIQLITIADHCTLGAGATLIHSTQAGQTLVGVPARPISKKE
ncbi:acetyltransferase [Neiella sp. HB171785]|uniref:Acetyltransferase n=1 Tax=Neiella litorisoli TaxID=2771431 RepID=A0A8J6QLN2_9GAMM|nr:acetyltransferase [Neiella litorisoli]MBD1390507.1 acetyltransferase [Neiella litorisoli]